MLHLALGDVHLKPKDSPQNTSLQLMPGVMIGGQKPGETSVVGGPGGVSIVYENHNNEGKAVAGSSQ